MKTNPLAILLVIPGLSLFGQLEAGRKLVSVSLNYQTQANSFYDTNEPDKIRKQINRNINGTLKCGKFVKDRVMWGAYLGEQFSNAKTEVQTRANSKIFEIVSQNTSTHLLGTFLRYYKSTFKNTLALYAELAADGGYQNRKAATYKGLTGVPSPNYGNSERGPIANFSLSTGLVYFLNTSWAVEASCSNFSATYRETKSYNGGSYYRNSKNFNTNLNLSFSSLALGMNFYFGTPKLKKAV